MDKRKKIRYIALDLKVLVVATEGEVDDWAAYIGAVAGNNHDHEWQQVKERGTKIPKAVAEVLFPDFKHLKWRH